MHVGIDVGGTFTDLVALDKQGLIVIKTASTPDAPERGIWDVYAQAGFARPPEALIHGTTIATNALLERTGARAVLVLTEGFEDLLELRRQNRAALYDLSRHHPAPLVTRERVVGAPERMGPNGVMRPLTDEGVREVVARVSRLEPEAVGISLLFGFRHPAHEMRLAAALRTALPGVTVVAAHELVPRMREFERTSTVAAEAYLRPKVGGYVGRFAREAVQRGVAAPRVLASSGGALRAELAAERAVWLALSGPAGGIQGAALVGAASGFTDLLTLDMGGTSADAGVVLGGEAVMAAQGDVAGVPVAIPHLAIETVSAGGGSIARMDSGGALRVGPASAGAVPGPACYGRGGSQATVTDAYLTLGWIQDGALLGGSVRVSRRLAEEAVGRLAAQAGLEVHACALGIIRVVEATMTRALRRVSVERGLDPATLTLVAFGGAGPLSGCALAELLGVRRVLLPPLAGVLSALGMAAASDVVERSAAVHLPADAFAAGADVVAAALGERLSADLPGAVVSFVAECRYVGQGYELDVPCAPGAWDRVTSEFHDVHQRAYGHKDPSAAVEVMELRAIGRVRAAPERVVWPHAQERGRVTRLRLWTGPAETDAAGYAWEGLLDGQTLAGPSIIEGRSATAFLPTGWMGRVNAVGAIVAEPGDARPR